MEAAAKNERIVVKLIILGCANVGKTSLMKV
jgi:GTPase SAR1 family protein